MLTTSDFWLTCDDIYRVLKLFWDHIAKVFDKEWHVFAQDFCYMNGKKYFISDISDLDGNRSSSFGLAGTSG